MNLNEIRKEINFLDSKIMNLLNDRMELALMAKRFKSQIEDSKRERELFDRIRRNAKGLVDAEFFEKIYGEIVRKSKNLQQKDYELIAFQGEHGAYSEVAAKEWNSNLIPIPCMEFVDVLGGVTSGLYSYGIIPVENTLGGVVGKVNELLINMELNVVGAIELPIHLCLLALPGTDYREIRNVLSHPQVLAQCRHFLARNRLDSMQYYDTAGAAKMLAEKRPKATAAIASKLSAELYSLDIIKENIEDLDRNMTRFLILSKKKNHEEGNKCSVIFSTEHKAGTLFRVLEVFARKNINLTRIESIPHEPGSYAFFLDFIGSNKDEKVVKVLNEVKEITNNYKMMGCYKERKAL